MIERKRRDQSVTVYLSLDLYQWLERKAQADHRTLSAYVENLLRLASASGRSEGPITT